MSEERTERSAKNEALFREVNERIELLAEHQRDQTMPAVCECSQMGCTSLIDMSLGEYEDVRADGDRFAVAVGHEDLELERVVELNDRFAVVEKTGAAGEIAEQLDPRS